MAQLYMKGVRVDQKTSILIDDASYRREKTSRPVANGKGKRWLRLPEQYENVDQKQAHQWFAQLMMASRTTKVVLLFGTANHNRFQSELINQSKFRIKHLGNLDPVSTDQTCGRVYLLFQKSPNQLERIVLMVFHPENTLGTRIRDITYRKAVVQDLLINLATSLSFTPLPLIANYYTASVEKAYFGDKAGSDISPVVSAAMRRIQHDIRDFVITRPADSRCPDILRDSIDDRLDAEERWLENILGQQVDGYTAENNRMTGFPNLKLAHEVNRANGFPGLKLAHEVNRANGFPAVKFAVEANRATGFQNLKLALAANRATGFQNTKGALKKAWEGSRLSNYEGSKRVLVRAREVNIAKGCPGLQTAAKNRIEERLQRAVSEFGLVRPDAGKHGSQVSRQCSLCHSKVRDDDTPLYTQDGRYVAVSQKILQSPCQCSHARTKSRILVPTDDTVRTISWDAVRGKGKVRNRKKGKRTH
jgi:hypothetical protein